MVKFLNRIRGNFLHDLKNEDLDLLWIYILINAAKLILIRFIQMYYFNSNCAVNI